MQLHPSPVRDGTYPAIWGMDKPDHGSHSDPSGTMPQDGSVPPLDLECVRTRVATVFKGCEMVFPTEPSPLKDLPLK
jgi:hypothetical protein